MKSHERLIVASSVVLALVAPLAAETPTTPEQRIVEEATERSQAWDIVEHLTDFIGPRPAGSRQAAAAVEWTAARLRSWGLDVRTEPVTVTPWVRGEERAWLSSHYDQKIVVTALGGSVATTPDGITAPVVIAHDLEDIDSIGETAKGKIVLFNEPMDMGLVRSGRSFEAYSRAVRQRGAGASRAAKYGAVAALVRSVGSASLRTPHTGAMRYDPDLPKIPAGAITSEDADLISRLIAHGETVTMRLILTPHEELPVESANVVADWKGSGRSDEIVLIGGHLDSWDLGTGAIDDGAGVAGVMETVRVFSRLGLRPKRTIRVVLFMNEEHGLDGGRAYRERHDDELGRHFATLETDGGAGLPLGFITTLTAEQIEPVRGAFQPLAALGANTIIPLSGAVGADTSPLTKEGVVGFGLMPDARHYFDYHHTPADTLDKIDPGELARNAAAVAVMTWILADLPGPLGK